MPAGSCKVLYNHFPALADRLDAGIGGPVEETAQLVARSAAGEVPKATGSAAASVYYVANGHDGYAAALAEAMGRNPSAQAVERATPPPGKGGGVVAGAVAHDVYLELGTRYMPARPWFLHWADDLRGHLETAVAAFLDGLRP